MKDYISNKFGLTAAIIFALLLSVQCSHTDRSKGDSFEQEKQEVLEDLESLRQNLNDEIRSLSSRLEESEGEKREDLQNALSELRDERSEVNRAIEDVRKAGRDSWDRIKTGSSELYRSVSGKLNEWIDMLK
jgi:uncharacterized coiled-coil DUF342 family protein